MGILPKESWLLLEDEDDNDETMAEGEEGNDEGVWIDGENDLPDDLRYNGEGNKNCFITREHAEDSFKQSIATLARSEAKATIQFCSQTYRPSLST